MKDKGLNIPFMLSRDNKLELEDYLETGYAKSLKVELHELVTAKKITSLQKQLVMAIKADEYYRHCAKGTAWGSVKYYLENFPELFSLHDLFFKEESTEKYFIIINSYSEEEFEKVVSYQKLDFKKHKRELPNGKFINIYIIYLELSEQYSLESHPVRKVWRIAESSGIRVGFHNYRSRQFMNGSYTLGLYRSFPIDTDSTDDFSRGAGGLREDIKAGFKSSWEANVARILQEKGLTWKYEEVYYQTDFGTYIPDFIVKHENKTYIIEVKGLWDERSVKKVSSVLKEAKDEEVVIIDSDLYPILEDKYGDVIPNWEKSPKPKGEFRVPVVGIFVGDRMKSIDKLQKGDSLKLIRDPKNSYDPYAIKIMTIDNKQVGFIAARWAAVFSKKIDDGFTYEASLSKKDIQNSCIYINLTTKTVHHEDILKKIPFL